jgi:hypothetical protein
VIARHQGGRRKLKASASAKSGDASPRFFHVLLALEDPGVSAFPDGVAVLEPGQIREQIGMGRGGARVATTRASVPHISARLLA